MSTVKYTVAVASIVIVDVESVAYLSPDSPLDPDDPELPDVPVAPELPDDPDVPVVPELPDHRRRA